MLKSSSPPPPHTHFSPEEAEAGTGWSHCQYWQGGPVSPQARLDCGFPRWGCSPPLSPGSAASCKCQMG